MFKFVTFDYLMFFFVGANSMQHDDNDSVFISFVNIKKK